MKYVVYYCDIYETKPVWLDLSKQNIHSYYSKFGIDIKNIAQNNDDVMQYAKIYGGFDWWSILASKTLCIKDFMESDYDMMIATDLDYVTLRADIDIRDFLKNINIFVPHQHKSSASDLKGNGTWMNNKVMFYGNVSGDVNAYDKFLKDEKKFIQCSSDFFAISKNTCSIIVEYFKAAGWDLMNPSSYAQKYLQTIDEQKYRMFTHGDKIPGVDMPEVILGAFMNHVIDNNLPINIDTNDKVASSTWDTEYKIDLKTMCESECIFHHFGSISRSKPDMFLKLLLLFNKV